ncbi:chemotaxis protein CheX [Actinophytocola xanthii]|uniref:Chemotaxis protein CheX n=1 Tax=Actinophytocola xanthii TaxID=1912961 RepID=A0A1Q8BXS9_9PSEU|nr:chemotaxis protein CheX [Actinophytocola xanthii]OLF06895.1 chemotaxis protein CheX [Actinophytocola xanthii]
MSDQAVLPTTNDLEDIAGQVWAAFLDDGHEVVPSEDQQAPFDLSASVAIMGAFEGHVIVQCTTQASRDVASVLFEMPTEEVSEAEIGDALGELANVLGGNLKSMLPGPSTMSLPRVAETTHEHWPSTVEICRTVVTWRDEQFTLLLLSSDQQHRLERDVA